MYSIPVNAITLMMAGILLDAIIALSLYCTINNKFVISAILSFISNELGYLSYFYITSKANMENNLNALHWYALGCGLGTFLVFVTIQITKRRHKCSKPINVEILRQRM